MSMRIYTILALAALALIALPTIAAAQLPPSTYTRPLTVLFYKGSIIEMFVNFTELRQHYGIGSATYWFFALYKGPNYVTDLNILVSYTSSTGRTYYCQVKYIPDELPGGATMRFLLMEVMPNTTMIEKLVNNTNAIVKFELDPSKHYYIVTVQVPGNAPVSEDTDIYGYVRFHHADLEQAIKDAYNGVVPSGCQKMIELCREESTNGYCWVRVLGLVVPVDVALEAGPYYVWVRPVERGWSFQARPPMYVVTPTDYISINEQLGSLFLAFGREIVKGRTASGLVTKGIAQYVKFEGYKSAFKIVGQLNVTIAWSDVKTLLAQHILSNNLTIAVRLLLPGTYAVAAEIGGTYEASSAKFNYTYNGLRRAARSLLFIGLDTQAASTVDKVYGAGTSTSLGVFNRTRAGKSYIVINATVNPYEPIVFANKVFKLKYQAAGKTYELLVPALEANISTVVYENNAVLQYYDTAKGVTITVTWGDVGANFADPNLTNSNFTFRRAVIFVVYKNLTILPASYYIGYTFDRAGDTDRLNPHDVIKLNVTNMVVNSTEILVGNARYVINTTSRAKDLNFTRALMILDCGVLTLGEVLKPNYTDAKNIDSYAQNYRAIYTIEYELDDAPYGGRFYYPVVVIKANASLNNVPVILTLTVLPPVNYTTVPTLPADHVAYCDGTLMLLVKPYLYALVLKQTASTPNTLVPKSGYTDVLTGGFILVAGFGFNLTDPTLKLVIGNVTISFGQLDRALSFDVLDQTVDVTRFDYGTGRFAVLVPLFALMLNGYKPLGDYYTGYMKIRVMSDAYVENEDWAYNNPCTSAAYDSPTVYHITYGTPVVLVDPAIHFNMSYPGTCAWDIMNVTVVSHAGAKTPYEVYKRIVDEGYAVQLTPYGELLVRNATRMTVVVIGFGHESPLTTEYYIRMSGGRPEYQREAYAARISVEDVIRGFYYNVSVYVPTLPYGTYSVAVYNATEGIPVGNAENVNVTPSIAVMDVYFKRASISVSVWDEELTFTPTLDVLPRTTVKIYGYGFYPQKGVVIYIDNVPRLRLADENVTDLGTWEAEVNITAAQTGQTLLLNVSQPKLGEISDWEAHDTLMTLRVTEIVWTGLTATIATGHVVYEGGEVKLPVFVTVTYMSEPLACSMPVKVTLYVYTDFTEVPPRPTKTYDMVCVGDGIWYALVKLEAEPKQVVLIAKVVYDLVPGVQRLTAFATIGVTLEPELKPAVEAARAAAEEAASNVKKVEETLSGVAEEVARIRSDLAKVSEALAAIDTKLTSLETMLSSVSSKVDALAGEIKSYYSEVTTKLDRIAGDVDAVKRMVSDVSGKIEAVADKVDSVAKTVAGLADRLDEIAAGVEDVKSSLDKLARTIASAKDEIIAEISRAADTVVTRITTELSAVKSSVEDVKKSVETLSSKLDELSKTVSGLSSKLEEVSKSVSGLADKITEVKTSVMSELGKIGRSLSDLAGKVSSIDKSVGDVKSKVDSLSANVMIFGAAGILVGVVVLALLIYAGIRGGLFATH